MAEQYYYLISGLPSISLDENRALPSFKSLTDDIVPLLSNEDREGLRLLRADADIRNVVRLLEKSDRPFDMNGNLSEEDVEQSLRDLALLPPFVVRVIESRKDNQYPQETFSLEDRIFAEYFRMLSMSANSFLRAYGSFESILRNLLAGINARKYKVSAEGAIVGDDSIAGGIRKSGLPDFGLSAEYPWVNKMVSLPVDDPVESERRIDSLRWSEMEGWAAFEGFGSAVVFAFVLKLRIAERWKGLMPEVGKGFAERLVKETRARLENLIKI